MENLEIRILLSDKGLMHKDVAKAAGIRADYLSFLLRYPLSEKNRERILQAVRDLTEGVNNGKTEKAAMV